MYTMEWVCGCPFMLGKATLVSMPSLMGLTSLVSDHDIAWNDYWNDVKTRWEHGMTSKQLSKHENVMGTWKRTLEPFCNM
jgi:hypothetical protein